MKKSSTATKFRKDGLSNDLSKNLSLPAPKPNLSPMRASDIKATLQPCSPLVEIKPLDSVDIIDELRGDITPDIDHDSAWDTLYAPFFDTLHEGIKIRETIALSSPIAGMEIFEHALKMMSPLTIFSPDIVNDTLQKAREIFYEKLEKSPETLGAIAVKHFEMQQKLYLETIAKIQGDRHEVVIESPKNDRRFQNPLWETIPYFSFIKQNYLLFNELMTDMLSQLDSLDSDVLNKMRFYMTQMVEAFAPTNFVATNPDVLYETFKTKGENLKRGMKNLKRDLKKGHFRMTDTSAFTVGKNIAATKGHVVFENALLQLIRYEPTCEHVHKIPLLIIPAWINKYYLFDLTEKSSFVKWCLDKGMDVYIISWVNPDKRHAQKTFCDYTLEGLYKAVEAVLKTSEVERLNALGNCAGGILLNCLMAYLESHKIPSPFASATTLASPIDADKLGDLKAFICKDQLKLLEESLEDFSIIPGNVLMQSFNLLRPKDLLWSFYIKHYLLGKEPDAFDILFWNCDSTNLPGHMHSQYLRNIFLENKLIKQGAMRIAGTPIDFKKIMTPSFIVGAKKDHIVPWNSVYPLSQIISSAIKEFVLVGSGHVSGIINPPSKNKYQYWTNPKLQENASDWVQTVKEHEGSWWGYWCEWLTPFLGKKTSPCPTENPIESAPGRYVMKGSLTKVTK